MKYERNKLFDQWVDEQGGTEKTAERLGIPHHTTKEYRYGRRYPSAERAFLIHWKSHGKVPADSWPNHRK